MKLTPEQLEELKAMAEHARSHFCIELAEAFVRSVPALIADLEEAQHMLTESEADNARLRAEWSTPSEIAELCKQLAEAQALLVSGADLLGKVAMNAVDDFVCASGQKYADLMRQADSSALDAAIAEAIADEKQNPWKQAIINELVVSHILNAAHETDPRKALAALVDYECEVALDPAVSKEAQALLEPYRKDAERYRWLTNDHDSPDTRKACHDISARIPVMSYSAASQAIDAAIAAKGETNEQP